MFDERIDPGRISSFVLAAAVHLALFAVLVFGVRWQNRPPEAVQVELWSEPPPAPWSKRQAGAQVEPAAALRRGEAGARGREARDRGQGAGQAEARAQSPCRRSNRKPAQAGAAKAEDDDAQAHARGTGARAGVARRRPRAAADQGPARARGVGGRQKRDYEAYAGPHQGEDPGQHRAAAGYPGQSGGDFRRRATADRRGADASSCASPAATRATTRRSSARSSNLRRYPSPTGRNCSSASWSSRSGRRTEI